MTTTLFKKNSSYQLYPTSIPVSLISASRMSWYAFKNDVESFQQAFPNTTHHTNQLKPKTLVLSYHDSKIAQTQTENSNFRNTHWYIFNLKIKPEVQKNHTCYTAPFSQLKKISCLHLMTNGFNAFFF